MIQNAAKSFLIALGLINIPAVAQAGTATDTGTAILNVVNQCMVDGVDVKLGTFTTSQTWDQVGTELGKYNAATFTPGAKGLSYLTFGTVICDKNFLYSLTIKGSGADGAIKITHNGKTAIFLSAIKKVDGNDVNDNMSAYGGTGAQVWGNHLSHEGSGTTQTLLGNVTLDFSHPDSSIVAGEALGISGIAQDTLTYELKF